MSHASFKIFKMKNNVCLSLESVKDIVSIMGTLLTASKFNVPNTPDRAGMLIEKRKATCHVNPEGFSK